VCIAEMLNAFKICLIFEFSKKLKLVLQQKFSLN